MDFLEKDKDLRIRAQEIHKMCIPLTTARTQVIHQRYAAEFGAEVWGTILEHMEEIQPECVLGDEEDFFNAPPAPKNWKADLRARIRRSDRKR